MDTNATPNKELNREIFNRIISENIDNDHRSLFDQQVNQEEFREKLFGDNSEILKNNPAYKIRSVLFISNRPALREVRDDMARGLLEGSIASELVGKKDDIHIHQFSHYNPIGEDFLVETQMINVGYSNSAKTPMVLRGFGFIYLVDCESGRKLYAGVIVIEKKKKDERPELKVYLEHPIFEEIRNQIDPTDLISFFIGKDFTDLRNTLLKHTNRYRVNLVSYKTDTEKGRAGRHKQVVALMKSMSPNLVDFVRLADIKKVMFDL